MENKKNALKYGDIYTPFLGKGWEDIMICPILFGLVDFTSYHFGVAQNVGPPFYGH